MKDLSMEVKGGVLEQILTQKEAASYLRIDKNTLIDWGKMGVITPFKIVGRVYYKVSDIQALFSRNEGGTK